MRRGAIFIGVDRTGNAPTLQDAAKGARRMSAQWGATQGLEYNKLLTDEKGKSVTAKQIKDAVKEAIAKNVEQLVIYFAGHGINRNRQEYWLLSGAPDDTQEAVNVAGSIDLAFTCNIRHVVFISDACRTAADSILAGSVSGSDIFPNQNARENPVDQFFACRLGMPSNEVKDPKAAADGYKAIYTDLLLSALSGGVPSILTWEEEGGQKKAYVRPQPLETHLEEAMVEKLTAFAGRINQEPCARILSKDPAFISLVPHAVAPPAAPAPAPPAPQPGGPQPLRQRAPRPAGASPVTHITEASHRLIDGALKGGDLAALAGESKTDATPHALQMMKAAIDTAVPFGPASQETGCGFKVQGALVKDSLGLRSRTQFGSQALRDVVTVIDPHNSIVLLEFDDGSGTVLPAIREFMCALRFDGGELVDVAYEPSQYSWRFNVFMQHSKQLRELRAIASAASRDGVFRLEGDNSISFARQMQFEKGVDPGMAVYAAHAYYDLGRSDLLKEMSQYMQGDLGACLFDVAMFARLLDGKHGSAMTFDSPGPLLAQGWAYLGARRIKMPSGLEDLPGTLKDSLWTLFDAKGVKLLRKYIQRENKP